MSRVRLSIQEVQRKYEANEDRTMLENLIKAFRGIQAKEPSDPDSFFCIAGYHGEPFTGEGVKNPEWWGGYCNHGNVLFPTWHRAYVYRLENALRTIPGCENVTLPFWDETFRHIPGGHPIPSIFTNPHFPFKSQDRNPLYSYKLQKALEDQVLGADSLYSKPEGYETVRYPLSGLVGTLEEQEKTKTLNDRFKDEKERENILNNNVAAWLDGTVKLKDLPDHYSVSALYKRCLDAPNYTTFSNTTSANAWQKEHASKPDVQAHVVPLESPHNSIHLAVGGFEAEGINYNMIQGANGDMGENETAGFDPIFFFHHCFIDYVFWRWQVKNNLTKRGSLTVLPDKYPGTFLQEGTAAFPPGTILDMNTSLEPFKKPHTTDTYYTPNDVTNIADLGYSYGAGSLDHQSRENAPKFGNAQDAAIVRFKHVSNINRAKIPGSFVIRTYAITPSNERVEIGREAILSRWNVKGCQNCQNNLETESIVPIDEDMLNALREGGDEKDVKYKVVLHTRADPAGHNVHLSPENRPKIGDL